MKISFINRFSELHRLKKALKRKYGLVAIVGRRRVGKSALLRHFAKNTEGCVYIQAIDSAPQVQIEQICKDLSSYVQTAAEISTWEALLELLKEKFKGKVLIIDEFPYLAVEDPSLPSRMQRWIDGGLDFLLILAGSSQTMMHQLLLEANAPLYHRADDLFFLLPMNYALFCEALGLDPTLVTNFERYSLVGGIPKYWEWVDAESTLVDIAEELFFETSAPMHMEPSLLMNDEGLGTVRMKAVLDVIGRGAVRPSEMASRLQCPQSHLSTPLSLLVKGGLLKREIPFGQPSKNPKIVQYKLSDPALRFWFEVFCVHQTRWPGYADDLKARLIHEHAAKEFEPFVVAQLPLGTSRFWNKECEIDGLRTEGGTVYFYEIKWTALSTREIDHIVRDYAEIHKKHFQSFAEGILAIYDQSFLQTQKPCFKKIISKHE